MDKLKAAQRTLGMHSSNTPKVENSESQPGPAAPFSDFNVPAEGRFPLLVGEIKHKELEIAELHRMCDEKDEQIDALSRPMVVRLDFWLIGIVALVFGAHNFGYM